MITRKLPTSYSLYDPVYGSDLPIEQLFVIEFDSLASRYENNDKQYEPKILEIIESLGFSEKMRIFSNGKKYVKTNDILFFNFDKQMYIKAMGKYTDDKNEAYYRLDFFYNLAKGKIEDQIDMSIFEKHTKPKHKSNISLVKFEMGHMDTEEFELNIPLMELELNYGNDFLKVNDLIVNRLNVPNGKGIILLHGDPGTGKTSYIKYLTSLITDKNVLFVPPSMAEMLSEPSIIPFLMDHKNSILIIEDAERVIGDREINGSAAGVSNILNLTDGILGDCLGIQIIATFNMKREKIDQALLRKGRLIAEHKFEKLSVDDSNKLLKKLNKGFVATEPMALADIYNIDVETYKTNNKSKIGLR